ncbi:MAG TPA: VWA domain-containing protein [Bryobacteraceae bacterium]|jgi:Ca-activated chloride channel family protein|nr:VWA domain-containing protein [Bryobacteraceae bacterium]
MRAKNLLRHSFLAVLSIAFSFAARAQDFGASTSTDGKGSVESRSVVHVPNRPSTPLFQGEQGKQRTEFHFDPATQTVTIKMVVQDSNGYFIPNLRRDNFAVFENGVREQNATVEIEHAPVSLAVLMEWGGRYLALNKALNDQVPRAAHQLLDELGPQDKIALFRYGDRVDQIADFSTGREALNGLFTGLPKPEFSELNFYDALLSTVNFMKGVPGRKAIVVISSGVDTFSKAKYEDALAAARSGGTPIYVIDIGPALRSSVDYSSAKSGPYARIDWKRAESQLQELAQASGGRLYSTDSTFDLLGVYDDLMENLRVRYVITYKSTSNGGSDSARSVRVELIDPASGGPIEIVDADGKPVRSHLSFETSYVPAGAAISVAKQR